MSLPRALALLWTLLILIGVSLPGASLPKAPVLSFDKVVHFGMFAVLGVLWLWALQGSFRWQVARVLLGGGTYAVVTELYQGLLGTGRQPDVYDALANLLGLLAAVLLSILWRRWRGTAP